MQGLVEAKAGDPGYPPSLQTLVEGVELVVQEGDDQGRARTPRRIKFLRRIPIDPLTGKAEWGLRCYESDPDVRFWCGTDVYDIYTLSRANSIDGTPYREW
jgi:general secretion pathway protein G